MPIARPDSIEQASEVMTDTARQGAVLQLRGAGTKMDWGNPPERVDVVVDTGGLSDLIRHDPGDMTATVGAGLGLHRLQEHLAPAGQWLAVDPPEPGATVGGVLSADAFGPRRWAYGAMRDNVIGVTVVLADGSVARSGGNVIKNVAGYDLSKLFCGSLGTLGLVAEVVVRLRPVPELSQTVRIDADAAAASALVSALVAGPVVASAIDWESAGDHGPGRLWVRIEGHGPGVEAQVAAVRALAAESGLEGVVTEGEEQARAWSALSGRLAGVEGDTVAFVSTLPDRLPAVAGALEASAREAGVAASLHTCVALGTHTARIRTGQPDPRAHAAAVLGWRQRLRALNAPVVVRRRARGVAEHVDAWGVEPGTALAATLPLQRALKAQLDPERRCAPGRMPGGI